MEKPERFHEVVRRLSRDFLADLVDAYPEIAISSVEFSENERQILEISLRKAAYLWVETNAPEYLPEIRGGDGQLPEVWRRAGRSSRGDSWTIADQAGRQQGRIHRRDRCVVGQSKADAR